MEPLLQVKNIAKEFPGVKALEDISIDFYPGECHALVGENGAGKSTLIKIIASIYKPTRGEVILDGKVCNFKTRRMLWMQVSQLLSRRQQLLPI